MSNTKVLLVDDEEEFVTTLAERLEIRGYDPHTTQDGEQALEMIDNNVYDVIVLDLMMPGLGGLEVMQQAKNRHPDLPIILLTGHGSTREGMEGMRQGAYDYLMKPLDIDELITKMDQAVGKTKE
ncbi:MAG: response regulator [Thermodesulfobacteriota bacterium]